MEDALHLIHLLKNAASCCERELQSGLEGTAISACQALVLQQIDESGESMSKLSKALCCHKSNITQIVDALVKNGIVVREPCKTDRRVLHLKLTSKGKELLRLSKTAMEKQATKCLAGYSVSEKRSLSDMLERFVEIHAHKM